MAEIKKFVFSRSFDKGAIGAEKKKSAVEEPPPPPTFSEEELEQAKQDAYNAGLQEGEKAGFEKGLEEARKEPNTTLATLLPDISDKLAALIEQETQRWEILAEESITLTHKVIQKTLPNFYEKNGLQELEDSLEKTLSTLSQLPGLSISLAEEDFEVMEQKISELCENIGIKEKISISKDKNLETGDCKIFWSDGGIEHYMKNKWKEIELILNRSGSNNMMDDRDLDDSEENISEETPSKAAVPPENGEKDSLPEEVETPEESEDSSDISSDEEKGE